MLRRMVLLTIPAVLLVTACSGDGTETPSTAATPSTTATSTTTASATTATSDAAEIVISAFSFGEAITVAVDDTVTIGNDDASPHTWTSDDGLFDSGTLSQGQEFTFAFDEPGEYAFHCEIHPSMTGTITVTD